MASVVESDNERAGVAVDFGDGAGLRCDGEGSVRCESDDSVACPVAGAAGCDDLGAGESTLFGVGVSGELVEGVDVGSSPGHHDGVGAGVHVGEPAVEDRTERLGPVDARDDSIVGCEPFDGTIDVPVAEFVEGFAFGEVALPDVLGECPDVAVEAAHERFEPDRGQLPRVPDEHHLRPGMNDVIEQSPQILIVGHASLVEHQQRALSEGEAATIEPCRE